MTQSKNNNMKEIFQNMKKKRLLIELPTWLGDCVMATPAIENIIKYYNDVEITIIGSKISTLAMKHHPKVKDIEILEKNLSDIKKIRKNRETFDAFFSFRSSIRSHLLKLLSRSQNKYQFSKNKYDFGHQVEKYNNFVNDSLSINCKPANLKIYTRPKLQYQKSQRPLVGINPGASYGSAKRWSPKGYSEVAKVLAKEYDILIFGGPNELDIAMEIEEDLKKSKISNYQNLAGKTDIEVLIDLVSNLSLFITGDSGPMHIAAAFQIPTVAIFGPTSDKETSQWMNTRSFIVKKNLECQPCMKRTCPLGHHRCMNLISPKDVLKAAREL